MAVEKMNTSDILIFILMNKSETNITTMEIYLHKIIDAYKSGLINNLRK